MIKYLIFALVVMVQNSFGQSFFEKADTFFSEYVSDGKVDYQAVKSNPQQLDELVNEIAELDLSNKRVTPEFLKSFYINAYNLLVIKQVIENYPVASPMDIEGFFDGTLYKVMGEEMTLDKLEKQVLFAQFPDPRLHFVLVCAANSCPPLASYSYQPEEIDRQLTERTSQVMNLDWFIRVKGEQALLSKVFDWYRDDFGASEEDVITYINRYRNQEIGKTKEVSYYEYDWSLNDK